MIQIKETTEQLEELQDKNQQLEEKLIKTTTELEQSREKENRINLTVKELEVSFLFIYLFIIKC